MRVDNDTILVSADPITPHKLKWARVPNISSLRFEASTSCHWFRTSDPGYRLNSAMEKFGGMFTQLSISKDHLLNNAQNPSLLLSSSP